MGVSLSSIQAIHSQKMEAEIDGNIEMLMMMTVVFVMSNFNNDAFALTFKRRG